MADNKEQFWLGDEGEEEVDLKNYLIHMGEHFLDSAKGAELPEPFRTAVVFPNIASLMVECLNLANQLAYRVGSYQIDIDELKRDGLVWSPPEESASEKVERDNPVEGELRVWAVKNPPGDPTLYPVESPEEAKRTIKSLSDTFAQDRDTVVAAFGLVVWKNSEWTEWTDEKGRNIYNLSQGGTKID